LKGQIDGQAKVVERHVLFLRDGKRFDITLEAQPSSFGKASTQLQSLGRSVQFTEPAAKPETLVKQYEYKDRSVQFTLPASWSAATPCHEFTCNGSYAAFELPLQRGDLPPRQPGKTRMIHSDGVVFAAAPAQKPNGTLADAVAEAKAAFAAANPKGEYKSAEKTKVGGVDAVLLTSTTDGDAAHDEPTRVQRRVVTLVDGKVYQFLHASHEYSVETQKPVVDAILASVKFTSVPPVAGKPGGDGLD
jgi:hypothetical protein